MLKTHLKISLALVFISWALVACDGMAPPFNWTPKLYYGDARTQSIQGSEENIKTNDQRFDEMVCMSKDQPKEVLKKVRAIYEACEVWKKN